MVEGWLRGWPAIADYINTSLNTAKTYSKEYFLPVYKGPGRAVFALPYELDQWLKAFSKQDRKQKELPPYKEA